MPSALSTTYKNGIFSPIVYMKGRPFNIQNDTEVARRHLQGETLDQIADFYGVVRNTIKKSLERQGIPVRRKGHPLYVRQGSESHNWKGGRTRTAEGYIKVWANPDSPFFMMAAKAGPSGNAYYIPEHRLVMATHLGRPLFSNETVHHKNGVRDDNRIENLELRLGHHGSGQVWRCADCGSHNIMADSLHVS